MSTSSPALSHPPDEPSDEALILRVQQGDIRAYDTIIGRYKAKLYSTIYHMTGHHEDAADLLQETLIRAFKAMPRFRSDAKFSTWAYRIAVNVTINHLREKRGRSTLSLDDMDMDAHELDTAQEYLTEEALPSEEDKEARMARLQNILNHAIQNLSENHRAVVVLHDIENKTHAQIAEIIGVPEGTVKTRLFHAHKLLQKKLGLYLKQDKEW